MSCSVAEAKRRIPASELSEWIAYLTLRERERAERQWARDKSDYQFAQVVWNIRAAIAGTDKAGRIEDYLLEFRSVLGAEETPEQRKQKVVANLTAWKNAHNTQVKNANRFTNSNDRRRRPPPTKRSQPSK